MGSSEALPIIVIISGENGPISSTLNPNPKLAMPLVRASADDIDLDLWRGSGFNKLFIIALLLPLPLETGGWYDWWIIGSGANFTLGDDC